MKFIDKAIVLRDISDNEICIFVDKVSYLKEGKDKKELGVGMVGGSYHVLKGETVCSFLSKINLGCEGCSDAK
jgi:hypothetical protein